MRMSSFGLPMGGQAAADDARPVRRVLACLPGASSANPRGRGKIAMLARSTAFALALLSPVEAFSPSLAPVRPQLLAQRNAPGVSALLVDSADAVQQAHAAVAAAPHVVPHMQGFASQLLADSGLVEGMTDEARQAASGELGWWGTYIKFVEDGILALRGFYLKQASLSLSLT